MSAPRLHIIALGGTIASAPQTDAASGVMPTIGAEQIAAAAQLDTLTLEDEPPLVTFEQLAQVGSGSITLTHLFDAVRSIRRAAADGADGVVLTQGTDTLEDSAFVLALLNDAGIPVVLTGAMRNPSLPGADGGANVRSAARTALDPRMKELAADRRLAAALVFADEVFDPLSVTKAHTTSVAAFQAGLGQGPLGWVSEDRLVLPHAPAASRAVPGWSVPDLSVPDQSVPDQSVPEAPTSDQPTPEPAPAFPRVAVLEVGLDDDLSLVEELAEAGYAGCVLAGVGGGHVPQSTVARVAAVAAEVPVVLASRTGAGATLERTYGYPGAEIDLLGRGLVPAGTLNARKARLALILALHFGTDFPVL
ncbi:MAG: asparaginase domain-containing protein [Brevibacterium yomogidense]|uniref:L-asparaginase n=1 Tax=Brevibacterium yomogidense TaxID=946573 RepID=A0A1X6WTQ8_9MICO|nr:asparaginase domain-containing protein [Brevibacterium yomogidense]SLM88460.1 L-asparaginase [Brevibacterium yomogidense]